MWSGSLPERALIPPPLTVRQEQANDLFYELSEIADNLMRLESRREEIEALLVDMGYCV